MSSMVMPSRRDVASSSHRARNSPWGKNKNETQQQQQYDAFLGVGCRMYRYRMCRYFDISNLRYRTFRYIETSTYPSLDMYITFDISNFRYIESKFRCIKIRNIEFSILDFRCGERYIEFPIHRIEIPMYQNSEYRIFNIGLSMWRTFDNIYKERHLGEGERNPTAHAMRK